MGESQFCRLCLTSSVVYYSLLQNNGKEMVSSLAGIEVNDDDVSTESCAKCWLDLKLGYFIQQSFVEAEKKLNNTCLLEPKIERSEIKIEPDFLEGLVDNEHIEVAWKNTSNSSNEATIDSEMAENTENLDDDNSEIIYIQTEDNEVEESHICSLCGLECIDQTTFYSHINIHYKSPQQCDECSISLPNIPAYRSHVQYQHPNLFGKIHVCCLCPLTFKYRSLYNLHVSDFHTRTIKTEGTELSTMGSNDDFDSSNNYESIEIFSDKKADGQTASTVPRKRITPNFVDAEGTPLYKCMECDKVFENKKKYTAHTDNHRRKICPICGVSITSYNLNKHIITHKTQPVICEICGKVCKHSESLRWHRYYAHTDQKLTCEECGQQYKRIYTYKMHLRKHAGQKTFICDTCGRGFYALHRLNIHIKSKHLKQRPHICKYCDKGFSKRDALRTHERQHTKELPYVCEICGEGFRQNVSLRSHRKSKHNVIEIKNVECPICQKKFRDDWALQTHTFSLHG